MADMFSVYVDKLPSHSDWRLVKELFRDQGIDVTRVHMQMDPISNKFRGGALVDVPTLEALMNAINRLHDLEVCGQRLIVAEEKLLERPGLPARREGRGDPAGRETSRRGAATLRANGRDMNGSGISQAPLSDSEERPPLQRMPRPPQKRKAPLDERNGTSHAIEDERDERPSLPRNRPVNLQPSKRRRIADDRLMTSPPRRDSAEDDRPALPRRNFQRAANWSNEDPHLRKNLDGFQKARLVTNWSTDDQRPHAARGAGPSYSSSSSSRRVHLADDDTPPPPPPDFRKTGYVEPPPPDTRPGRQPGQRRQPPRESQQPPPREWKPSQPRERPVLTRRRGRSQAKPEHRRLFCENLPADATWHKLKDFFKTHFELEFADVQVVNNEETYGVVEFRSREEALEACMTFNGLLLRGKPIRLRQDRGEFDKIRESKQWSRMQDAHHRDARFADNGYTRRASSRRVDLQEGDEDRDRNHSRRSDSHDTVDEDEKPRQTLFKRSGSHGTVDEEDVDFEEVALISPGRPREDEGQEDDRHQDYQDEEDDEAQSIARQRPNHVYVSNLDFRVTSKDLQHHMKQAGEVLDCYILKDEDGKSKGCGLVEYSNQDEVGDALEGLHGSILNEREILVKRARHW